MPAPRLTDSQKQELVARYRQGETAQALADAYGCSPNTVSRVVKAALSAEELAEIRKQGRSAKAEPAAVEPSPEPAAEEPVAADEEAGVLAIDDADEFGDDDDFGDRKSTRLNSSHVSESRMPSSA